MTLLKAVFSLTLLLLPPALQASEECNATLATVNLRETAAQITQEVTEAVKAESGKQVHIIWYPNSRFTIITHTELEVDGQLWDGTMSYKKKHTARATEEAARNGDRGYVSFGLQVTNEEFSQIKEFLDKGRLKLSWGTCSGGACRAVSKNSGVFTPPILRQIPTLMAAYLTLAKLLGYRRIAKIEWVGPKKLTLPVAIASVGFVGPFIETYYSYDKVSSLLVTLGNHTHGFVQFLIPLFHHLHLSENDLPSGREDLACHA